MIMKKAIAFFLALVMALSLCACGKSKEVKEVESAIKAIGEVTRKYIEDLQIKCTSSKQKAKQLSGGNQQKVCLAKAFALEPKFLFVSEPTRGIDVGAKALVLEALKKFNRESGVTIVMISSELEELRQVCDRIAIVSGGRIAGILPATDSSEDFGALMVSQVV